MTLPMCALHPTKCPYSWHLTGRPEAQAEPTVPKFCATEDTLLIPSSYFPSLPFFAKILNNDSKLAQRKWAFKKKKKSFILKRNANF